MASASNVSTEKLLQTLVECPICLGTFKNPQALQCLHFYCEPCIKDFKPAMEGNQVGYLCPMCRQFTANDKLRPMYFIKELLDVVQSAKTKKSCDHCKTKEPKWRCGDCKEEYCDACRQHHDRFAITNGHECIEINENSKPIVDRRVYCLEHPKELVKFYCDECHKLICILCNGTKHKNHPAQTIEETLSTIIPKITENRNKVEKLVSNTEQALQDKEQSKKQDKAFDKVECDIENQYNAALEKVHNDYKTIKKEFNLAKEEHQAKSDMHIKSLEIKLKSQKNIVQLSDTTLSTAQGTSLLSAIHSGLGDSLLSFIEDKEEETHEFRDCNLKFIPVKPSQDNSIGLIEKEWFDSSATIPLKLSGLTKLPVQLSNTSQISNLSVRFAKVQDQLWRLENNTNKLHVCRMDGSTIKTLAFDNTGTCYSVRSFGNDVIIAAQNGLFICSGNKDTAIKLHEENLGPFYDVSVLGSKLFALDNKNSKVRIFVKSPNSQNRYIQEREFNVSQYRAHEWNTIHATEEYTYIGLLGANKIIQHKNTGEFIRAYGSHGKAVGQLHYPLLCGSDKDGILLIADYANHRFQSLDQQGVFKLVQVEGLGQYPVSVVFTDNRLLVLLYNNAVQEFTFK